MTTPRKLSVAPNYQALLSGLFAAVGSTFGKLTGMSEFEGYIMIRIVCFALMLLFNTSSLTFYVKGLQASNNTLTVTVSCAATNYLLSAILGIIIFGEATGLLWWTGGTFIVFGLLQIMKSNNEGEMVHEAQD